MGIDKAWHLASTDDEIKWIEFELQLQRISYAFDRWQLQCEKVATGLKVSVDELTILHVIRMHDRSKTIIEVGNLLNRVDYFNMNYIIKNLLKKGLVIKDDKGSSRKYILYKVTEEGRANTDRYTETRRAILFKELLKQIKHIDVIAAVDELLKIKHVYDEAYRVASSARPTEETLSKKPKAKTSKKKF